MKHCLLKKGDVIRLEKGMKVYTRIPERFKCPNAPFSNRPNYACDIRIGEVLHKNVPDRKEFEARLTDKIQKFLHYDSLDQSKISDFINSIGLNFSPEEFDTSIYEGEYRVYSCMLDSIGNMDSEFMKKNEGWHVFCEKISNPEVRVHFFQTGFFSAMIPNIKPIKK